MKKIIALSLMAVSLSATSVFAQGYFAFVTSKSQAYDGFTTAGVSGLGATVDVAFMWAPVGTTPTGLPLTSTPTSGNSNTSESYTAAQAWADILACGFTAAVNSSTSLPIYAQTAANGGASYQSGANVGVVGTSSPIGTTQYALFLVGWNASSGATSIAQAAADGASVGWSSVFTYTAGANSGSSTAQFTGLTPSFGVFTPAVVPEPGTLALAALGGAAMLFIRRKK